ncbi:hypothetical protein OG301_15590 [Streptomyces platensis]|uniref:hypothetical protein n=1 Tax=Streptomyces platensis TaxID=58346 RepID=UPI002ED34B38|nr:hypothetical protein OG301_15590 [Streptomyces platensis]
MRHIVVIPPKRADATAEKSKRREGLAVTVLTPDYQRIMAVLEAEEHRGRVQAKELATVLGFAAVPAKIEGMRSKVKRMAERGWAVEARAGVFSAARWA